ncbi:Xaa-Pro peptidase family protein [Corynebacterium sp. H127]|uniref:M24 family metallopeptidase n=1 Tax=Corynebacterium sp. H127 TaxID=3133418 RepID=UPI003095B314
MTKFPDSVYVQRIEAARAQAAAHGIAGLVFGPSAELAYLTGSWESTHERFSGLVIPTSGSPTYIAPAVDAGNLDVPVPVQGWEDGQNPYALVRAVLGSTDGFGVGSALEATHLLALQTALDAPACLATPILKELFMRKSPEEVAQLREAAAAIDAVHAQVSSLLIPGKTETAIAAELHELILASGHTAVDFVIVGSGPNGGNPHHSHSSRKLKPDDIVVVDIGGTWGVGYHSDCTRTYFLNEPPAWYRVLEEAQRAAVAAVRPGVTAAYIDAIARSHIADAGYGDSFIHRTGHGIGLSLHEDPFIMQGNDLVLEPGMAFSVEPGMYFADCGARIEDIVVVTEDGCEVLNRC